MAGSSGNPWAKSVSHFVEMGFPENIVRKTLEENGINNTDLVLEILLTHSALERCSSESSCDFNDFAETESCLQKEENVEQLMDMENKLLHLICMGFSIDEASSAVNASGPDTPMAEIVDFIYASQTSTSFDAALQEPPRAILDDDETVAIKKRKLTEGKAMWKRKVDTLRQKASTEKKKVLNDDVRDHFPKNMIGYGVPNIAKPICQREIPEAAVSPPYFYYGNSAVTSKGVWSSMSHSLFGIEPEFVDSSYFCASARTSGYVHNLPLQTRFCIEPIPPLTIQEVFPSSKKWWPLWDNRTKLDCLGTGTTASGKLVHELGDTLKWWKDTPPSETQDRVLNACKKWNLIWVGKHKLAPLEPDEIELILGYPKNHSRGGGICRSDRYKSLANTFQVDTVAYHLSVLKSIFPDGLSVLSLFSGLGGAEVALHRVGIRLKKVVSLEVSDGNRSIIRSWWEGSKQTGILIQLKDVKELSVEKLKSLGGFDLVVGGNQGQDSGLFQDYVRILKDVKATMGSYRCLKTYRRMEHL